MLRMFAPRRLLGSCENANSGSCQLFEQDINAQNVEVNQCAELAVSGVLR